MYKRQADAGAGGGEADHRAAGGEHHLADGVAFGVVGVEQRLGGAVQDGGELPAQVGRVLEAGVHALAARGRVAVGGVAGEEDVAVAVGGHLALVGVEAGDPPGVVHAEVGAEGAAGGLLDLLEVDGVVVGLLVFAVPGEDAPVLVAEGGDEAERAVAARDGGAVLGRVGELDVGEHDRFQDGLAGVGHADGLADGAADAVGADDVSGLEVARAGVDGDLSVGLVDAGDLGVVDDAGARAERALLEDFLHVVLRGHEEVGEARLEVGEVEAHAVEQADAAEARAAVGEEFVGEAAGVEHLERAGVDAEGPREVGQFGAAPFEDDDLDSGLGEIAGQEQAGGAGADDDDCCLLVRHGCLPWDGGRTT